MLAPHRQRACLEIGVLLQNSRDGGPKRGTVVDRVTADAPPIVVNDSVRAAFERAVDVVVAHRRPERLCRSGGLVGEPKPTRRRPHPLLGVRERAILVVELKLAHRRDPPVAGLEDDEEQPLVLFAVFADSLTLTAGYAVIRRHPAYGRTPPSHRDHHGLEFFQGGAIFTWRAIRESRARPILDAEVGGGDFVEQGVEVGPVQGQRQLGDRGTRFGECRALSGVIALL